MLESTPMRRDILGHHKRSGKFGKKSAFKIQLLAPAGVENAETRGGAIAGRWKAPPRMLDLLGVRAALLDFINLDASDDSAFLRFVRRFGPVMQRYPRDLAEIMVAAVEHPDDGGFDFEEKLSDLRELKGFLTETWRRVTTETGQGNVALEPVIGFEVMAGSHDYEPFLRAASLAIAMHLIVSLVPPAHMKECGNPDCTITRYFINSYPRAAYCSNSCAEYGQKRAKINWWAEHGTEWRKQRSKKDKAKGKR